MRAGLSFILSSATACLIGACGQSAISASTGPDGSVVDANADTKPDETSEAGARFVEEHDADVGAIETETGSAIIETGPPVVDSGVPSIPSFLLGADITSTQQDVAGGATFIDQGVRKPILQLLKDHGFNSIRLRTFVDPTQSAPNPLGGSFAPYSTQGFADLTHTIAFGKELKAAGMAFLLDFHYSDTWADPGKQIKPAAWASDNLPAALSHLQDYTRASVEALVAAGARPDIVQIGNEITPGILLSPGAALGPNSKTGWVQLAQLLNAAIGAVRLVDPTIQIMLHIDRGGDRAGTPTGGALAASIAFIDSALANGVHFDIFGESCYVANQGPPSGWKSTFDALSSRYPNLRFVIAEYNVDPADPMGPELRAANDILFALPNHRGLGTFIWEPTETTPNLGIFTSRGSVHSVIPACISQYDQMRTAYGL